MIKWDFFSNMKKPEGKLGEIQLKSMNKEHSPLSQWGLKHLNITTNDTILDVGCGGGINIKRMSKNAKKVYGIDYSDKSVKISKEMNEDEIKQGKVEIHKGDVQNLPYPNNTFDIVTAFETVYFWPNIEKCFGEIKRVLKPNGIFLIGVESNGSDDSIIMRLSERLIDMKIYDEHELSQFLINQNYSEVKVYLKDSKNKEEIIKTIGGETIRIKDDYDKLSISDKFLEWMCIIGQK